MDNKRVANALMRVETLSGRERRPRTVPAPPPRDPNDAAAALALGAADVMGLPSAVAGLYSPELRDTIRGPMERNPDMALVGGLAQGVALPRLLSMITPKMLGAALLGIGTTAKPTKTSEVD